MPRDQIFVSYSHRDRKWLDELMMTLAPLIRKRSITVWDDTKIDAGQKWKAEIRAALERAKVAVLLVTRGFLASEFIANEEMPNLLDAARQAGLIVVWIAVGDSLYEETEITEYQAANDPAKPLNSLSEAEVDKELVLIAKKLNSLLLRPADAAASGTETVSEGALTQSRPLVDKPIDSDATLTPAHRRNAGGTS